MKNKEKYDLNTLKIDWTPLMFEKRLFTVKIKRNESIIFSKLMKTNETGSSAYNAWLEQEYKPPILDDVEKTYLSLVIKPFRNRIVHIGKTNPPFSNDKQYLFIELADDFCTLPNFKEGTMYKGMKNGKRYTLKELGL
nr:MAG TPA: hypothetical protein [Caudoviricetes sp.]